MNASRFAIPGGRPAEILDALARDGLDLARARVAAALGDPDPFPVRSALLRVPADTTLDARLGAPITPDALDAVLLTADAARPSPEPRLAGLFAGRPPGPLARAVPVDGPGRPWLRWPARPTRAPTIGDVRSWTTAEIGDNPVATVRCVTPLGGPDVALGSDYGLTLFRGGRFEPFPWPAGARREARRVEAMTVHDRELVVGTTQARFTWDFGKKVSSHRHGADDEDGFDELAALLSVGGRLYAGLRTHFEGGQGPRDVIAMAADPAGVVYAGTRDGELHVIDGGHIRTFADHKPRPIRHLAFAEGALWVAAAGEFHRFDGSEWSRTPTEPTALAVDAFGRLWALAEGRLHVVRAGRLVPVDVPLERPWALGAVPGALWIGGRERVWRVAIS